MVEESRQSPRRLLYPEIEPYDSGYLPVSDRHQIWYEQCGNPEGQPALFVHGGPGGGCEADDRRYFDPAHYRIVLFDQRGAGRSKPHACTEENTTWHLVDDMERLRTHLGIDRWLVFGGSWGSTLSLLYAETHADRVTALVVRGIFLVRQSEFDWYYRRGTPLVFAEAARDFHALIPESERDDMVAAYYRRIQSDDPDLRERALAAWATWEAETSSLIRAPERIAKFGTAEFAAAFAGIELHYFVNAGFFEEEGQLLRDAGRLAGIPGVIVHGRYDMVCPFENALQLKQVWPRADLIAIDDAGHAASEPGTTDALIRATDRFRDR
jgi:proline iminopeptidase